MPEFVQMPTNRFAGSEFTLVHSVTSNRLKSGQVLSDQNGPSFWQVGLTTQRLDRAKQGQWQAFFDKVAGGLFPVLLHDPARPLPIAYQTFVGLVVTGGGAFNGTGNLQSITDLGTIVVEALPAGFDLAAGDYFGIEQDGRKSLHRIQSPVVASAGGVITIEFLPRITLTVQPNATVHFDRPQGEFVVDQRSVRGLESTTSEQRASFSATSRAL